MEEEKKKILNLFLVMILLFGTFSIVQSFSPAMIGVFKNMPVLTNIIANQPLLMIIIFSFMLSLYTTLFYKYGLNKEDVEEMKKSKQESKELQKKMQESKNDPKKMAEIQKEMMEKSMKTMSLSFKTLFSLKSILLTLLPSVVFLFLIVGPLYFAADIGYLIPLTLPFFGKTGGWLFCNVLGSLIFSPILKKILKVEI